MEREVKLYVVESTWAEFNLKMLEPISSLPFTSFVGPGFNSLSSCVFRNGPSLVDMKRYVEN